MPTNRRSPSQSHAEQSSGTNVGSRIKSLREQRSLSIRELALTAEVAPSLISRIEAGKTSPTVMSLQKILNALDIGFHEFFAKPVEGDPSEQIVFPRDTMVLSEDTEHSWFYALPKHPSVGLTITLEEYRANTQLLERSKHAHDIGGIVLSGELTIEVFSRGVFKVHAGDAFYIKAGTEHSSRNETNRSVKLISVMTR